MTYFNSNDAMHFNTVRFPGALNLVKMLTNAIPSLWFFNDINYNYESIFVTVTTTETALKYGHITTVVTSKKSCLDIFSLFTHQKKLRLRSLKMQEGCHSTNPNQISLLSHIHKYLRYKYSTYKSTIECNKNHVGADCGFWVYIVILAFSMSSRPIIMR